MHARWATLFPCCLGVAGCLGDDTNPALPPTADASPLAPDATANGDATTGPADAEPPPLPFALVRVANWSPDAPGIDFCLAPHGTTAFAGPLLRTQSALLDAAAPLLAYPAVSAYFEVSPGQYDVRAVVGGATDCAVGIGPDLPSSTPLGIGTFATLALLGRGPSKRALAMFVDEGVSSGKVALRFINGAPAVGAADFGTGTAAGFKPIFKSVSFGAAGTVPDAGGVDGGLFADSHGYAVVSALSAATLSARATGAATDAIVAHTVTIAAGAVITTALLEGLAPSGDGGVSFQLLECVDNAASVGIPGSCAVLGP